jgi:hypothetical protein
VLAKRPLLVAAALPIVGLAAYAFMSEGTADRKNRRDGHGGSQK